MRDVAPDELQKLADDIKQHGMQVPPVFFRDEHGLRLLDGRNRLDAAELAGDFRYGGPLQRYIAPGHQSVVIGKGSARYSDTCAGLQNPACVLLVIARTLLQLIDKPLGQGDGSLYSCELDLCTINLMMPSV
jgi:hypothetical protein